MHKFSIVSILLLLVIGGSIAWQAGASELANINLRDDMQDMGSQLGTRLGLIAPPSDSEVAQAVIRKAREHGIELEPDQVIVRRVGSGPESSFYIAADYKTSVNLLLFSFRLHFTPSSKK